MLTTTAVFAFAIVIVKLRILKPNKPISCHLSGLRCYITLTHYTEENQNKIHRYKINGKF